MHCYTKALKQWEERIQNEFYLRKIKISFFVGGAMAAKYAPEGDGLAGEGWNSEPESLPQSVQRLVRPLSRPLSNQADARVAFFRLNPDRQVDAWQLISVYVNRQRSLDTSTILGI